MTKLKKFFAIAALVFFGAATASVQFAETPKYEVHVESYKVRLGETFWEIAEHYRNLDDRDLYIFTYMDELRELNPYIVERKNQLQPNDLIEVRYLKRKQ